jgi:protoheme IX farnesyltransferase
MSEAVAHPSTPVWRDLIALAKPRITLLVIITTAGGLWLAPGRLGWTSLIATLVGTVVVVAAANALNCYLERDSDKLMSRTRDRPLPAGRLAPSVALFFGLALAAFSLPVLTFLVNPVTGLLAATALVSYVCLYTPLKHLGPIALVVGSVPGAMPPLLGWSAVTGGTEWPGLVLFGILFVWQIPHFLAIAIYRQSEYERAGIRTLPIVRGVRTTKWHAVGWSLLLLPVSLALVPLGVAGPVYFAVALALGLGFLGFALAGFKAKSDTLWARNFFLYSLIYLTALFAALVLDAGPLHVG